MGIQKDRSQDLCAEEAKPSPNWGGKSWKFCFDSSCQNQNLFQVVVVLFFFFMWITGGATTGICIQTGTLQISSNPGDKGMTFMICDCYSTCVNCQNKAFKKANFSVTDAVCKQESANIEVLPGLAQGTNCCPGRAAAWSWWLQWY